MRCRISSLTRVGITIWAHPSGRQKQSSWISQNFGRYSEACLAKLPARVGDVFMLREMEQMTTAQICQALKISHNNLWVMLHRARMALRECLESNWFENKP